MSTKAEIYGIFCYRCAKIIEAWDEPRCGKDERGVPTKKFIQSRVMTLCEECKEQS